MKSVFCQYPPKKPKKNPGHQAGLLRKNQVFCGLGAHILLVSGPDLGGAGGPGPQASHQQGVSHQTPQFLKPCNSIANPFQKSQIRHWAQAFHQGPRPLTS